MALLPQAWRDTAWAMSQENVEIMRAVMNAFAREDLPAFLPLMDPEIHFEPHLAGVEGGYTGHDGVERFFTDAFETFEILDANYPDIRDLGDQVLVLGTLQLNGRESGIKVENPLAIVARVRKGLITYLKDYAEGIGPSKPPGCRSSCAVTPRPRSPAERVPPVYLWKGGGRGAAAAGMARYCVGDVGGERGDHQARRRGVERR